MSKNGKWLSGYLLISALVWVAILLAHHFRPSSKPVVITNLVTVDSRWMIVVSNGQNRCGWKYDDFKAGKYHYEGTGGLTQQQCVDLYLRMLHNEEVRRQEYQKELDKWEFIPPPKRHFDFDPTSKATKRGI